jgi:hypothetical protein
VPLGTKRQSSRHVDVVHTGTAEMLAERSGPTHTGDHALADQITLELGDRAEHVNSSRRLTAGLLGRFAGVDLRRPSALTSSLAETSVLTFTAISGICQNMILGFPCLCAPI